ncbi:hypothetical protein EST38_g12058 [Candolleomyces aberdarensis]|uniref:Uncharacterized protein n=1 Tax=Candolleomyces aberdarensis TaxID=2316362 RepID=A0A4Q2D5L2_9AGAR|nr:hypothetical protein EST38_g12058 [Candolleomyces aberdarensis]
MQAPAVGGINLWDLLPVHIRHDVLSRMSLVVAIKLALTSTRSYALYKDHCASRVNRQLSKFGMPVPETLDMMQAHKAVLSGSVAVLIVEGGLFIPGDLDIFVPKGTMEEIHKFVVGSTQYTQTGQGTSQWSEPTAGSLTGYDSSHETGIVDVRIYAHQDSRKIINVIETSLDISTSAVMLFHTTFVMSFVTWNAIVSAYPLTTSKGEGLLNSYQQEEKPRVKTCLDKYKTRGFTIADSCESWKPGHLCGTHGYCGRTIRKISDPTTMRICFTEWSNKDADVIDRGMEWRLACRNDCRDSDKYRPSSGWVCTSSGIRVDRTVAPVAPPAGTTLL